MELAILNSLDQLRINDLIAKIAHVRAKDTIRVLLALQAVSKEYDLSLDELVNRYLSEMERFA